MAQTDLGLVLDSFSQPAKDSLRLASRLAFREVELPATGEVDPAGLSSTGRRHLSHFANGLGLRLSALGGDTGGSRFDDPANLEKRVEYSRGVIELAAALKVPVVTTHLGRVDEQSVARGYVVEALREMAAMADRTGVRVAVETGGTEPALLSSLFTQIDTPLLGAAYDPAALLMEGREPMGGLAALTDRIHTARIRDALAGSAAHRGEEMPVGEGQIDFAQYLAMLGQAGYNGTSFIRRRGSHRPEHDVTQARRHIESLLRR